MSEVGTKPLPPIEPLPLASLHVVHYLRWEHEGAATAARQHAQLLTQVTETLKRLYQNSDMTSTTGVMSVLLGGQTILLEDLTRTRPDLIRHLATAHHRGQVDVGPWYVLVNEALVSGESLIRNLLIGRTDAETHGFTVTRVAFMPDIAGHVAQLPQILEGFGVDAAFLHHGAQVLHLPFDWSAPNGSRLLVISHDSTYRRRETGVLGESLKTQQIVMPDGPYLWMQTIDKSGSVPAPPDVPAHSSRLPTYVNELRRGMPDPLLPRLSGELRLQTLRPGGYLLSGTLSARLYLKQRNAKLQNYLTSVIEPRLAIAMSHGEFKDADNAVALLNLTWRTLLKNQAYHALNGTASDAVHDENEIRYRQVEDYAAELFDQVLDAESGQQHQSLSGRTTDHTYLMVWNAHNWTAKQVVEIDLDLPPGKHPADMTDPDGNEVLFGWDSTRGVVSFLATAPGVGYSVYTLTLSDRPTDAAHMIETTSGETIAHDNGSMLTIENGSLTWRYGNTSITDLLRFYDGGDAGDTFSYSQPRRDTVEQGALVTGKLETVTSPTFERLVMRHRMRVAPSLKPDRTRERGVRLLDLTTTATFYSGMPGVYFRTEFANTAHDHRLRAFLRTGLRSKRVMADSAFGVVDRLTRMSGPAVPPDAQMEGVSNTHPMLTACGVSDGVGTMAMLSRGLPEFEAMMEAGRTTLALTLLRAVGWASRADLASRTAAIGAVREAPGAQCERDIHAEYALMPITTGDPTALIRAGRAYNAPLHVQQFDEPPERHQRSYLSILTTLGQAGESDGSGVVLTAFKPPRTGRGWVLRLLNPTSERVEATVTPFDKPRHARLASLAEDPTMAIETDGNGSMQVILEPHQIVTVRLTFS